MSEFRWDSLKGTWIITENQRTRQPREFIIDRRTPPLWVCPFCPGQEHKTPAEIFALRPPDTEPNTPGWQVRVVPNKFPVLRIEGELTYQTSGLFRSLPGVGAHEVIIETPDHHRSLADLDIHEILSVLQAYRARLLDLRQDLRFRYLQIYKNYGVEAGAPLLHAHSQLMAVPITPPVIRQELSLCRHHFNKTGRCLICELVAQEVADGRRIVSNDGRFLVLAPYASSFPFELALFPIQHNHDFALQSDDELLSCAKALQNMLRRLSCLLHDPPFNFILHTAPPTGADKDDPSKWQTLPRDYHWHIKLVPRLNQIAGFEWGSGFFINPLPPEDAAAFLRSVEPELKF